MFDLRTSKDSYDDQVGNKTTCKAPKHVAGRRASLHGGFRGSTRADAMKRNSRTSTPDPRLGPTSLGGTTAIALLLALLMLLAPMGMVATAGHQDQDDEDDQDEGSAGQNQPSDQANDQDCRQSGYNMQCNAFGSVRMETRMDVKGEHVESTSYVTLNTDMDEENARWVMFSLRNTTPDGSPVEISVDAFETNRSGDVITTREIKDDPNKVELWVDTLDLPVGEEIRIEATVAVTERGAYQLETVVIPFDRAYEPIRDAQGQQVSLFSYTMLGVNEPTSPLGAETSSDQGGWMSTAQEVPTLGAALAAALLGTVALATRRMTR